MFSHSSSYGKSISFLFIIICLSALFAEGQNPPAAAPAEPGIPTVITNVDEVNLDLVIRTKKNKPVLDLKPEDLNVTDNGTPVKLKDLRLVSGKSASDRMVTFLYDQMSNSSATNARNLSDKILKMFPNEGFYFSVLNFQRRLRLYQEFTTDRDELKKAINFATEVPAPGAKQEDAAALPEKDLLAIAGTGADSTGKTVSQVDRENAQALLQCLKDSQEIIPDHNVLPSLTGLLALSQSERRLKGRKAIVYFVQGFNVKSNAMDTIRSIVGAANRAGVSVYVIDVNAVNQQVDQGLMSQMVLGSMNSSINQGQQATMPRGFGASNTGGAPAGAGAGSTPGVTLENGAAGGSPSAPASGVGVDTYGMAQAERFQFQDARHAAPMAQLADSTGGIAILAGENPKKGLQQFLDDLTTYYVASYAPPNSENDGKFRPISVVSPRKDLRIQTRSGYFAVPPGESSYIRAFEAPLLKILSGNDLPSDLKLRTEVLRHGNLSDGNTSSLVVEVPVADLDMLEDHNTNLYSLHLSIVAQIKNKDGVVIDHFSQDFPQRGTLESKDEVKSSILTMQKHFVAGPGQYVVEAAVLDQNSGKASAQRANFEIENSPDGPSLSDLSIVRRTARFDPDTDPQEPMRYENDRVVPNVAGEITRDAKTISLFFMIHAGSNVSADANPPTLDVQVSRNGSPIGRMPLPLRKLSENASLPYMASIQAGALPPGDYSVIATLSQDEKTSVSGVSFHIPGSEIASADIPTANTNQAPANPNDTELVAYSKFSAPDVTSHQAPRLVITPATGTTAHLSAEQAQSTIESARKRALHYAESLPNFTCVEITDRSSDYSGNGQWRHRDSMAELLRFVNNTETRTTLSVNGKRSSLDRDEMNPGEALSQGEFGKFLSGVFKTESKTDFQWKETDTLQGNTVQVFSYHIAKGNSPLTLNGDNNRQEVAAIHGLVYIDDSTMGIRRITLESEGLPQNFSIHSTSITIDYDYVSINKHDYLMPINGTVSLTRGKHQADLNEIEFTAYKRYGAQTKISYDQQVHPK